jgi:carbon storage regulator CsrA
MYILRRKIGEGIRISKDITVYVLGVSGNEAKKLVCDRNSMMPPQTAIALKK